jgi:effector-binding domain-containing protein
MSFFDELKDFWATVRRLGAHWRILGALLLLLSFAGFYAQKRLLAPTPPAVTGADKTSGLENRADTEGKAAPEAEAPVENLSSQTVDVAARPVLVLKGQAKLDEAAKALAGAIAKLTAAAAKTGLSPAGRPLAVFSETDEENFRYEAMLPIDRAPEGKPKLPDGVEIGTSPSGKALKFEHRGSYDEIEATYQAIAAYLDEKGVEMKDIYVEEYLTDLSDAEDANVNVDIYVFLK